MITTSAVSYEQVKDEAPHLPLEDRSRLASRLLESLDDEDDVGPEWKDEIDRRLQEIDEGKAVMIPHAEVMPNVRGSLAKNRELRASNGALTLAQCLFEFGFLHHQGCEMIFSRVGACFGGIEPAHVAVKPRSDSECVRGGETQAGGRRAVALGVYWDRRQTRRPSRAQPLWQGLTRGRDFACAWHAFHGQ